MQLRRQGKASIRMRSIGVVTCKIADYKEKQGWARTTGNIAITEYEYRCGGGRIGPAELLQLEDEGIGSLLCGLWRNNAGVCIAGHADETTAATRFPTRGGGATTSSASPTRGETGEGEGLR